MKKLLILTFGIVIQLLYPRYHAYGQSYEELITVARTSYYDDKNFDKAGNYFDKAFSIKEGHWEYYYEAACSWSLAGKLNKSVAYLEKAYQNGAFEYHHGMLDDIALAPIRFMLSYQKLVETYNSKIDSIMYLPEFVKLISGKEDVTLTDRIIVLPYSPEVNKAYFASLGYKDSILSLPNTSVRLENCQLSYNYGSDYEGQFLLNNVKLKRLELNKPTYDAGAGLDKIEFTNCSFDYLVINGVEIEVNVTYSKVKELRYKGSSFELRNTYINEAVLEGENLASIILMDNTFNQTIRSDWQYDDGTYNAPLGIWGKFNNLELNNNKFYGADSLYPSGVIDCNANSLKIRDNEFRYPLSFGSSVINNRLEIVNNKFNLIDFTETVFPEFNTYIPFQQLARSEIALIKWDGPRLDLHSIISNSKNEGFFKKENFERLIYQYQRLYNNYRVRGEIESANQSYVKIKDMQVERYQYIQLNNPSMKNYFQLKIGQLLGFYVEHGTNPAKALVISFYILLIFAVFYFFFPSEWDTTSKARLIANFKDFRQKNDKGYVKPFFIMLGGFSLSLINALTLSLNSFVTLGFGTIPTKGLARYVCIIQGFIGWFLLSIFTVALINQVLA